MRSANFEKCSDGVKENNVCPLSKYSKNTILKQWYLFPDHREQRAKATNACEVNLALHTVYLIAAVPEMQDEEERLTALNGSDLLVSDPNMQGGQIRSSLRSMSQFI